MTKQREFKQRVRARMAKTGERYAAARMHLLGAEPGTDAPRPGMRGIWPGYPRCGGLCGDTGAMRNVVEQRGIRSPHDGAPYSEAMLTGLCGGIGFLYAVFEYKGMPPLLSVMPRHDTMPDSFIAGGLDRLNATVTTSETGSAAVARRALDETIADEHAALAVVDIAGLPYSGMPAMWKGMGPAVVGIAGMDGDVLLIDDRGVEARRLTMDECAAARGAYTKGRHRLMRLEPSTGAFDLAGAVDDAIRATVTRFHESPYKGFASNFGFAGLEKWQRLLTDPKDRKGWRHLFAEGPAAGAGLRRVYDGIEHEYTAPGAGRPLYAAFLDEAAAVTGRNALRDVASIFRDSGARWHEIADTARTGGDAALERGCALSDRRVELMDSDDPGATEDLTALWTERFQAGEGCTLTADAARALYERIAALIGKIIDLERRGIDALAASVGTT